MVYYPGMTSPTWTEPDLWGDACEATPAEVQRVRLVDHPRLFEPDTFTPDLFANTDN